MVTAFLATPHRFDGEPSRFERATLDSARPARLKALAWWCLMNRTRRAGPPPSPNSQRELILRAALKVPESRFAQLARHLTPADRVRPIVIVMTDSHSIDAAIVRAVQLADEGEVVQCVLTDAPNSVFELTAASVKYELKISGLRPGRIERVSLQ